MDFSKLEENSAQNRLGTGLGLSICKKITEQMKGSLSVRSKVGMGTSFTFKMITKCKVHCDVDFKSLQDDEEQPNLEGLPEFLKPKKNSYIFLKKECLEELIQHTIFPVLAVKDKKSSKNCQAFIKQIQKLMEQIHNPIQEQIDEQIMEEQPIADNNSESNELSDIILPANLNEEQKLQFEI